ncbi:MAG: A/G-specific adenine glycosylase [bacterium]|nr:A/G-specific adenine glycosylase [bacterium]MDD5756412.1 A/G-specific adenine glycosylase [bacterium]
MIKIKTFQNIICQYYQEHKRQMPWRETTDPYQILVSEIMLQQTQVNRVLDKYQQFTVAFPTIEVLAKAPLREILAVWQGLGYNRRALALYELAKIVVKQYGGQIPPDQNLLRSLPGIGAATAGSICAFAYNQPVVFIETNIRSVFLYYFFRDKTGVSDRQLFPFIEKTLAADKPREWYYALMDYGVFLKARMPNPGKQSRHYQRPTRFTGSNRQRRGQILKILLQHKQAAVEKISGLLQYKPAATRVILDALCRDGLVREKNGRYSI